MSAANKVLTQAKRGPSPVLFGFASYKDGSFELIVKDEKTGDETMLEGQLRPGQLAVVDRILPTCVFVSAAPAPLTADERSDTNDLVDQMLAVLHDKPSDLGEGYQRMRVTAIIAQAFNRGTRYSHPASVHKAALSALDRAPAIPWRYDDAAVEAGANAIADQSLAISPANMGALKRAISLAVLRAALPLVAERSALQRPAPDIEGAIEAAAAARYPEWFAEDACGCTRCEGDRDAVRAEARTMIMAALPLLDIAPAVVADK